MDATCGHRRSGAGASPGPVDTPINGVDHLVVAAIDHLVLAVADLADAIDWMAEITGVRPAAGGAHRGLGTHNALASFGSSYLELIAPDPSQPEPDVPRPFGVDHATSPSLVTFAVRPGPGETLDGLADTLRAAGHEPGPAIPMQRDTPDDTTLQWVLTLPPAERAVPFLIDWGDTPNPATTTPGGLRILDLVAHTPDPERLSAVYGALGVGVRVEADSSTGLSATVSGPGGSLRL